MKSLIILTSSLIILSVGCKTGENLDVDFRNIRPINPDKTVNVIIEIPAGTTAKYEMNKANYTLVMDSINGKPRYIDFLGYPGNYGMIPNTMFQKSQGGDGDPLDVIVLGEAQKRGSVIKVKIIGVLELLDNGEKDDKFIAIDPDSSWNKVGNVSDLDTYYPGVKTIISTFFLNYKGRGQMEILKWSDTGEAMKILENAIQIESKI